MTRHATFDLHRIFEAASAPTFGVDANGKVMDRLSAGQKMTTIALKSHDIVP